MKKAAEHRIDGERSGASGLLGTCRLASASAEAPAKRVGRIGNAGRDGLRQENFSGRAGGESAGSPGPAGEHACAGDQQRAEGAGLRDGDS